MTFLLILLWQTLCSFTWNNRTAEVWKIVSRQFNFPTHLFLSSSLNSSFHLVLTKNSFTCHLDIHFYDLKNSKLSCQIDGKTNAGNVWKAKTDEKGVYVVCELKLTLEWKSKLDSNLVSSELWKLKEKLWKRLIISELDRRSKSRWKFPVRLVQDLGINFLGTKI